MSQQMRLPPQDPPPGVPCPMRRERVSRGYTISAFARLVGVSPREMQAIEGGRATQIKPEFRAGFIAAGVDFDTLTAEYTAWRDARLSLPHVGMGLPSTGISPDEQSIIDAITAGVRGVRNIATRAGVPYSVVQQFLRQGRV